MSGILCVMVDIGQFGHCKQVCGCGMWFIPAVNDLFYLCCS